MYCSCLYQWKLQYDDIIYVDSIALLYYYVCYKNSYCKHTEIYFMPGKKYLRFYCSIFFKRQNVSVPAIRGSLIAIFKTGPTLRLYFFSGFTCCSLLEIIFFIESLFSHARNPQKLLCPCLLFRKLNWRGCKCSSINCQEFF